MATTTYNKEEEQLRQQLSYKATNNPNGIKYKSVRFGDQNYNIRKLEKDIKQVLASSYKPLDDNRIEIEEKILAEKVIDEVQSIKLPKIDIDTIAERAKYLIEKPIVSSNKIEQLVKDSVLNRWVKDGKSLHKDKEKCSFCDNEISQKRWKELNSHFDEESEILEKNIDQLIEDIKSLENEIHELLLFDTSHYYIRFHSEVERQISIRNRIIDSIAKQLKRLEKDLVERKNDILHTKKFNPIINNTKRIEWCWKINDKTRLESNEYSKLLDSEQSNARNNLRLREVDEFVRTIKYKEQIEKIEKLKQKKDEESNKRKNIENKIRNQIVTIEGKERLMNDEEKGAIKVNEFLNNHFGHEFLKLQSIEGLDEFGDKKIKFEIIRDGKKAHHLSEGECGLIAFCYFIAKLEDIDTKGSNPIIWIDDPVSSLDSNHIFFVHSLINSEIIAKHEFEQLVISTHNLDFLKYLKRLNTSSSIQRAYFLVTRENEHSLIKKMPKYLREYITEFNYLFHQIYLCAISEKDDNSDHNLYYNFGNNTRKFLEAFLFYKYPNALNINEKLAKYFGDDIQATSIVNRISNEFSHLEGLIERSMIPIDVPEMKKLALFILKKIKEKDPDQFDALLLSIEVGNSLV